MKLIFELRARFLLSSEGHFPEAAEPISLEKLQAAEPALATTVPSGVAPGGRGRPPLHDQKQIAAAYMSERSLIPAP